MDLKSSVSQFFKEKWDGEGTLLLGLSGGPDSSALFHVLLELKIPFAVAHVNHGWRDESRSEAEKLEALCQKNHISFHIKNLNQRGGPNLEDRARIERFAFFKEVILERGYRALILGHHADDLAETVLKRIFEGANLENLSGPKAVDQREGISLFRPLLEVQKKEILEWLNENKINYFIDSTNLEERFLRGRMRKKVLPLLSELFGKNVMPSLIRLGRHAEEFSEFIEGHISSYRREGKSLDFREISLLSSFEGKLILRDFFERQGITCSALHIEAIYLHLKRKSAHKRLRVGRGEVLISRGQLTLYDCRNTSRKVHGTQ